MAIAAKPLDAVFRVADFSCLESDVPTDQLAYHIQRALQEAGCYSGQLDNVWGPASRQALANFAELTGSAVPGEEPSPTLLKVVEDASPSAKCN